MKISRVLVRAGGICLGLLLVAVLVVAAIERRDVFQPDSVVSVTPADAGLRFQAVSLSPSPGVRLAGWFVPSDHPRATFVLCHGNAGNMSTRISAALALHDHGYNVFLFDYRGYGESTGRPSERGLYRDAESAWEWVASHGDLTGHVPVFIMGRSLGGPVAARLAAAHRPAGLIVEATFPSIHALIKERLPMFPAFIAFAYRFNTARYLARVRCPVLVANSVEDEVVPFTLGRNVYEAARRPKAFYVLTGAHAMGFDDPGYVAAIDQFVTQARAVDGKLRATDAR